MVKRLHFDRKPEALFLLRGEPAESRIVLATAGHKTRGISCDLTVLHADPVNQRKQGTVTVVCSRHPLLLLFLEIEPARNLLSTNSVHGFGAECSKDECHSARVVSVAELLHARILEGALRQFRETNPLSAQFFGELLPFQGFGLALSIENQRCALRARLLTPNAPCRVRVTNPPNSRARYLLKDPSLLHVF